MTPAWRRSSAADSSRATVASGASTRTLATGARRETPASVFFLRISPRRSLTAVSRCGSPPAAARSSRRRPCGPVDRPVLPPRPDLFGDERQKRGEQPQQHRQRLAECGPGRHGPVLAEAAVGAVLDQFDEIIAERPEERLGVLQRPGVVIALEGGGGLVDQPARAASRPGQRRRDRLVRARRTSGPVAARLAPASRTNRDTLRILIASCGRCASGPRRRWCRSPVGRWPPSSAPRRTRTARAGPWA